MKKWNSFQERFSESSKSDKFLLFFKSEFTIHRGKVFRTYSAIHHLKYNLQWYIPRWSYHQGEARIHWRNSIFDISRFKSYLYSSSSTFGQNFLSCSVLIAKRRLYSGLNFHGYGLLYDISVYSRNEWCKDSTNNLHFGLHAWWLQHYH
jgi:hypothetical protein